MDFAPYQPTPPETTRSPFSSPRTSLDPTRRPSLDPTRRPSLSPSPTPSTPPTSWLPSLPFLSSSSYLPTTHAPRDSATPYLPGALPPEPFSELTSTIPLRLDASAALPYLLFPPLGSAIILLIERKSDYVRFHAAQAMLLFAILAVVHWVVVGWSGMLAGLVWVGEVVGMGGLAVRAYRDAETLERYEVPIVGPMAGRLLGDE